MSEFFHIRSINRSRYQRSCDWCGESIEIGQPYRSYHWRDHDNHGYQQMHPECYAACCDVGKEEGGFFHFELGDFQRGCTCLKGYCECTPKPIQTT